MPGTKIKIVQDGIPSRPFTVYWDGDELSGDSMFAPSLGEAKAEVEAHLTRHPEEIVEERVKTPGLYVPGDPIDYVGWEGKVVASGIVKDIAGNQIRMVNAPGEPPFDEWVSAKETQHHGGSK